MPARLPTGAAGNHGGWFIALAVISGLVMASAVVALARSPLLSGPSGEH